MLALRLSLRTWKPAGNELVTENDSFLVVVVPFWAVWPFETLVLVKRHCSQLDQMTHPEKRDLGAILRRITRCYDALFDAPFPYSMGIHHQPKDGLADPESWHLHVHFYPPLLRSATVRKFMVGFELLASPQRDITAEAAASRLREVCNAHP